jgi:hypothetical protein
VALVLAFARMMPRIEADERLAAINDHAFAAGTMDKRDRPRFLQRLQAQARGEASRARKASAEGLASMGIGTRESGASAMPESPLSGASEEEQDNG